MVEGPGVAPRGNSADMADCRGELRLRQSACVTHDKEGLHQWQHLQERRLNIMLQPLDCYLHTTI